MHSDFKADFLRPFLFPAHNLTINVTDVSVCLFEIYGLRSNTTNSQRRPDPLFKIGDVHTKLWPTQHNPYEQSPLCRYADVRLKSDASAFFLG